MISSLTRSRPLKKWSQIFMERSEETKSRKHQMADNDLDEEVSLNMVTSLLEAVSDISIVAKYNRINECKHNIDNVHPPPKQKDWDFIWGTQLMCNICVKPALNNCTMCKKCNIIVHTACAAKQKPITGRNLFESKLKIKRNATAPEPILIPPEYNCPNCEESLIADLKHYEKLVTRLREEHLLEVSARMILRRFIIHFERRKLVKKRKAILLIQSLIRQRLARNRYKIWRKQLLRVVVFEVKHLPQKIMENGIVILTVFDTFKNMQLMRIDKTAECALQEAFFVAGVSAQMSVLITIGIREDAHTCYVIGQAHFCLRDIVDFSAKKMFTLTFVDKIKWPPQDQKHQLFTYKLETPPINSEYRTYFSDPAGTAIDHFPESHFSGKSTRASALTLTAAEHTYEASHSANYNSINSRDIHTTINRNNTIRFVFNPQNCVASICRMVSAPPLDILKRSVENGQKNKLKKNNIGNTNQNIGNYRNSRYWLCLYKLKLLLFQYYGDVFPRFITDLSEARAEVVHEKGRTTSLVNIIHPDNRVWLFEFSNKNDANKFEFAVNESRKAKNELKGSKFINSLDFAVSTETNFGFMTA